MNKSNKTNPGCLWRCCEDCFHQQHAILWPALSRTANLLVILNVSLFFLTGAVTRQGYRFPVYSLALLAVATLFILMPLGLHHRLWFYLSVLFLYVVSGWLLGASIVYWFEHPA